MLSVEDWAEIRRLHRAEGLPIKMIARTLGVSRNTVHAALAAQGPPRYVRQPSGSRVDEFEQRIREQLRVVPTMPATVIAERVGWDRGMTCSRSGSAKLRPVVPPRWWRVPYAAARVRAAFSWLIGDCPPAALCRRWWL